MNSSPSETDQNMWGQWQQALVDSDISNQLDALNDRIAQSISAIGPVCQASGRCCRFQSYGHRLYATGLEVAWVFSRLTDAQKSKQLLNAEMIAADTCPYQIEGLCSIHEIRPPGCRIYFCDPKTQVQQNELYEKIHAQIKSIHQQHDQHYEYMEWRYALNQAGQYLV